MEATLESPGSMADIAAMGWAAGPALSAGRHNAMDARLPDGRMIVMGGHDDPGNNLASTLILEPATNQWTPGPTMASARGGRGCAAELADGRIIAIGGAGAEKTSEILDPATMVWTAGPALTSRRCYSACALLPDGKVIVTGGNNGANTGSSTEILDLATAQSVPGPDMPSARTAETLIFDAAGWQDHPHRWVVRQLEQAVDHHRSGPHHEAVGTRTGAGGNAKFCYHRGAGGWQDHGRWWLWCRWDNVLRHRDPGLNRDAVVRWARPRNCPV